MPSDRFIGGENAVIDLETGISYSTVNDSEVVADLLNSLATPEPVSGGVEVAAREALELADEAMAYASDYFRKKWSMDERRAKIAAALSQLEAEAEGEQEAVVRWVAFHTDQHVVRPEPFELGMNFVVQSREAADRLAEILNAQPAPPVLVDAARIEIVQNDEGEWLHFDDGDGHMAALHLTCGPVARRAVRNVVAALVPGRPSELFPGTLDALDGLTIRSEDDK